MIDTVLPAIRKDGSYVKDEEKVAAGEMSVEEMSLRVTEIDGAPWFVAADICRVLRHSNTTEAIRGLDADEKAKNFLGKRETNMVSESGLYTLVMRSSLPEAKAFRKWVTSVVLPAIRKDGA